MEHLSLPRDAEICESERAYYIADLYDGGPFLSFPQRSRFADIHVKLTQRGWPSSSWQPTSAEILQLDVFLQTWLFFGLLHEIFGKQAPASAFVDQQFRVTTARLGEVVDKWVSDHTSLRDGDGRLQKHLTECITKAWHMSLTCCRTAKVSNTILRSIAALCETLEDVVLGTLSSTPRTTTTMWGWLHNFNDIERKMVENGWCPATANKARAAAITYHAVFYISKLQLRVRKDHSGCVGTMCLAHQSRDHIHTSRHASECDRGCPTMSVDEEKLMSILANGQVGVLDISHRANSSQMVIDVVPANRQTRYVAISHVWANGLGNPDGNYLPRCQIARLARVVQHLQALGSPDGEKLYLWLDTLCCPVKSEKHRSQCLVLMRQIYRDATHVLVLDAELDEYDSHEIDIVELCARLLFSVWSTRLWTLQEGALARTGNLWVQLRDRAINLDVVGGQLARLYGSRLLDGHLTLVLSSSLERLRRFVSTDTTGFSAANLVDLRISVRTRSVSVATDEPLCLATIMGLDQVNIAQAAPENRMSEFWTSMRQCRHEIPGSVLFFYGERLKVPGFRWAPVSFLERVVFNKFWLPKSWESVGVITDIGLQVLLPACEISISASDDNGWDSILDGFQFEMPIRQSSSRWYRVAVGCNVPGPWRSLSVIEIFRRNGGLNAILTEPALDTLSFVGEGADLSQAISGRITSIAEDGIRFSVETTLVVGLMNENDTCVNELAWQTAQDPGLQTSHLFRHPSMPPGNPQQLRPSDDVFRDILRVAGSAVEDLSSNDSVRIFRPRKSYLATCIMRCLGGWFGHVQQTWPRSQRWFVD